MSRSNMFEHTPGGTATAQRHNGNCGNLKGHFCAGGGALDSLCIREDKTADVTIPLSAPIFGTYSGMYVCMYADRRYDKKVETRHLC